MTYRLLKEYQIEVKKSKFLGFLYKIEESNDVSEIYSKLLKEHKKANHICFGGLTKDENFLKNDGEVGQPSRVMHQILIHKNLNSHILICVRYFGGIKLGVGGVSRAFRECSVECVENYLKDEQ